jgi:hypothetical protein
MLALPGVEPSVSGYPAEFAQRLVSADFAEIAGQRTILTYRADLSVKKLHFRLENAELRNVQISALEN